MVLSTEWTQVEVIDLVNDGTGIGFGIVGGRSTGVVIKSILPGGIADKDGRLQSGDHIIQIGDVNLRGFSADQVASVLRQAGMQVRMVVARPVESTCYPNQHSAAPIVPTKVLNDPEEMERLLAANGYEEYAYNQAAFESPGDYNGESSATGTTVEIVEPATTSNQDPGVCSVVTSNYDISSVNVINVDVNNLAVNGNCDSPEGGKIILTPVDIEYTSLPETERITVCINKNEYGMGITIAGYVCEREDLSGIFVKSISEGSEAHKCGLICINDRIIEVNGESLQECSNYEAVEKLKQTDTEVNLTIERYLRGPKYEHLQEALASTEAKDLSPPSPSVTTLSWIPIDTEVSQLSHTPHISAQIKSNVAILLCFIIASPPSTSHRHRVTIIHIFLMLI